LWVDPIGISPIFAALTQEESDIERRRIAIRSVGVASFLLFVFAIGGHSLLSYLGISLDAFRVTGGILLFLLAIDMVFARNSGLRGATSSERNEAERRVDISVFPMAIPLIAGPATMATLVLLLGEAGSKQVGYVIALFAALVSVLIIMLVILIYAGHISRRLGRTGTNVVTRVLGILLAALAIQFMMDGISAHFKEAWVGTG
jgi:MarC family membrane protein